jgi:hypothetical protein
MARLPELLPVYEGGDRRGPENPSAWTGNVESMLIAEDLLLLVTDDTSGKLSAEADQVDAGLGGALLVELTLMNKVDLSREGDEGKPGRLVVRDPSPTGDPVLDAALTTVAERHGKKPATAVKPLSKNLRKALYERLAASGVVRAEEGRVLGLFPTHRWPAQDARHEAQLREQLTQALVQRMTPDARTAALVSLIHALQCEHKVIDPRQHELSKRELRARAEEIAKGDWASDAVRKTIDEMNAAMMAVIFAATATSAGATGSS